MRISDLNELSKPYVERNGVLDRRFESALNADIPTAKMLVKEIFDDLDTRSFGIRWWTSLPIQERILISDYLYQCVTGIEVNLVEAKLHFLEWVDARERNNEKIANVVFRDEYGALQHKMPPPQNAQDELFNKLEGMHICGFFQAIGSSLDCLGAAIVGVLALPINLRRADVNKSEQVLLKLVDSGLSNVQTDFYNFFLTEKTLCGPLDWLKWTDQYRNTFVHRGRRMSYHNLVRREPILFDLNERVIERRTSTTHLAKYPDRSDAEAFLKSRDININEDAECTLSGIFASSQTLLIKTCERLVEIWQTRRSNPKLLEQPSKQWDSNIRACSFAGYDSSVKQLSADLLVTNPLFMRRMLAASLDEGNRSLWNGSDWE